MKCNVFRHKIGAYLDNEIPEQDRAFVEEHRKTCPKCSAEEMSLRVLFSQLEEFRIDTEMPAPLELWPVIGGRLRTSAVRPNPRLIYRFLREPLAAVASLAFILGTAGVVSVWLTSTAQTAKAESIDYSLLLDNITQGLDAALDRFLPHYHAEPILAERAHVEAPDLSFSLPEQLPTGQHLERVYKLDFGGSTGIAARYHDGSNPIFVLFHRPVEEFAGAHASTECIIGDRHGQQISVGSWRLVHFTDLTTCHCVLSTLEPTAELPVVVDAIAPSSGSSMGRMSP